MCVYLSIIASSHHSNLGLKPVSSLRSIDHFLHSSAAHNLLGIIVTRVPARELFGCGLTIGLSRNQQWNLLGRLLSGTTSLASGFVAFTLLPLGDASALIFTSPIVTFMLARVFLKEPIDKIDIVCACCCLVGVVFVARPLFLGFPPPFIGNLNETISTAITANSTTNATAAAEATSAANASAETAAETTRSSGILAGFTAALSSGTAYVFVRKLGKVRAEIVVSSFMLFAGVLCTLIGLIVFGPDDFRITSATALFSLVGLSFCGFVGQIAMTKGFAIEKAGPAAVMRYIDVIFAFIWSFTILGEEISGWSVLGASIIMFAAGSIALNKMRKNKRSMPREGQDIGDDADTNGFTMVLAARAGTDASAGMVGLTPLTMSLSTSKTMKNRGNDCADGKVDVVSVSLSAVS